MTNLEVEKKSEPERSTRNETNVVGEVGWSGERISRSVEDELTRRESIPMSTRTISEGTKEDVV